MKLGPAQLAGFLRQPPEAIAAVLLFGPDEGLVRERGETLTRAVLGSATDDPFRLAVLTGETLKQDPARLADEADALSLMGGRRVVRVRDVGDTLAKSLNYVLDRKPGGGLIVIEAGDLAKSSALRKLAEAAPNAAAIGCYADNPRELAQLIRDSIARDHIAIADDAIDYLVGNLGDDRGVTRQEIDKLCLFAGPAGRIDLAGATASVGDSSALELDNVIYDALDGRAASVDTALGRLFLEGQTAVGILRAVQRHGMRLHLAAARVAAGETADAVARTQRPPIYFKYTDRFRAQIDAWPPDRSQRLLKLLLQAELDCKTTGYPEETICRHLLTMIGRLPGRPNRR
ncbi:MAG: DNA polymerase III subunit delta [Aliidongia sp.]